MNRAERPNGNRARVAPSDASSIYPPTGEGVVRRRGAYHQPASSQPPGTPSPGGDRRPGIDATADRYGVTAAGGGAGERVASMRPPAIAGG